MKVHTDITLDAEVLTELRNRGENVSGLLNHLARVYLSLPQDKQRQIEIDTQLVKLKAQVAQLEQIKAFQEEEKQRQIEVFQEKVKRGEVIVLDGEA